MIKLTEAKCYKDIEDYIIVKGWDSRTVASRSVAYRKSSGLDGSCTKDKNQVTVALHKKVYLWLQDYQNKFKCDVIFKGKEEALELLEEGKSVSEIFTYFKGSVSKVTLYKYKRRFKHVQ
jgi:hypothetical protein